MKCLECGKPEVQSKGMCPACYTRWRRAGRPPTRFDYKSPVERYRIDCENGKVLGFLAMKMTHLDIARKYGIAEQTARRYMVHYKLIDPKAKSIKKKNRVGTFYDAAKMIALARPWVTKSERASYYG
jgi:hypothetical protein